MKNLANMMIISTLKSYLKIVEIHEDIKESDQKKICAVIQEHINKTELSNDSVMEGIVLADITAQILKAVK